MALNSSGPISLGGTTAGQSIEVELGGNGTTQISLNDNNVRTLAGLASGQIDFNTFYGKSSAYYFVGHFFYPSFGDYVQGSDFGPNGIYVGAATFQNNNPNRGSYSVIVPISSSGTFGTPFGTSPQLNMSYNGYINSSNKSVAYNPVSGSIFMAWQTANSNLFGGGNCSYLASYSPSGSNLSHILMTFLTPGNGYAQFASTGVVVDKSTGNVYVVGTGWNSMSGGAYCTVYRVAVIAQFDSSGTYSTAYGFSDTANLALYCGRYGLDGYLYFGGVTSYGASFLKYNSSMVLQYSATTSVYGATTSILDICADSSGRVSTAQSDGAYGYIIQTNSSGTGENWVRKSTYNGTTDLSIGVDSGGNIYVVNMYTQYYIFLTKFNSSGTVQWQNKFYFNFNQNYFNGQTTLKVSGTQILISCLAFNASVGQGGALFMVVPTDGTHTGSYTIANLQGLLIYTADTNNSNPWVTTYTSSVVNNSFPSSTIYINQNYGNIGSSPQPVRTQGITSI